LTAAQYKARFAPTDQETQAVRDWATSAGLAVTNVSPDNLLVTVQGPTTRVEQALKVTINDYQRDDGSVFRSNDRDATVPGGLNIQAVSGLSTYDRTISHGLRPLPGTTPTQYGYFPGDIRTAYDMNNVGSTASKQVIGLTFWGGKIAQSDFHTYAISTTTPELVAGQSGDNGIDWIGVDGNPMTDQTAGTVAETAQDAETSHGVAPGSHLKFWLAPCASSTNCSSGSDMGLEDALSAAANDPDVHIVSNSWTYSGDKSSSDPIAMNMNTSLQRGVSGGTTFYFATNDQGRNNGQPEFPSDSPYVVAVGATNLSTNADYSYQSETAWNNKDGASGGGCSANYARPSWQTNVSAATCSGRATPDVAADGSSTTPVFIVAQGQPNGFYGTSVAAPIWAGMTADIDYALGTNGYFLAGFTGPELYKMGGDSTVYPYVFHDVTTTPPDPCPLGCAYSAGTGWDEATGLGSPDASELELQLETYFDAPLSNFAGTGAVGCTGDHGPAAQARFNRPYGVATDRGDTLYISDAYCNTVRRVDTGGTTGGTVVNVAGTGAPGVGGYSGDGGYASSAHLNQPMGVAVDNNENLYIADTGNNVVREVTNGIIHTIAGTGAGGYNGDGKATTHQLSRPTGVAVDLSTGLVYIADAGNNIVRVIDSAGNLATVAGTPGVAGFSGDGGPATSAQLHDPEGVAVLQGNVYITDKANNRIRLVEGGTIATYAGNGQQGDTIDSSGLAANAQLNAPNSLTVDSFGNIYFTEDNGNRVREVDTVGPYIYDTAGNGTCGLQGTGGPASQAELCSPWGIAFDKGQSQLFIGDQGNARVVRMVIAH